MGNIILITGGAKSGKSSYALSKGESFSGKKNFIATAQAFDDEMEIKIEKHKIERSNNWETIEIDHASPENSLISHIMSCQCSSNSQSQAGEDSVILIDCLTLWLSNILLNAENSKNSREEFSKSFFSNIEKLIDVMTSSNSTIILVTNEVGSGIVPINPLAREFRELSGEMNKMLAKAAKSLYLVVCGFELKIK